MKKIFLLLLASLFLFTACNSANTGYDNMVNDAIDTLTETWSKMNDDEQFTHLNKIKITNTKVIEIKSDTEIEMFKDVEYIIEFSILSNYYPSDVDNMINIGMNDTVVFYKDGTKETYPKNLLTKYAQKYYDFSMPMVEKISDLNSTYNKTITLD